MMNLNERQSIAFKYLIKGYSMFITGDGGTGKSFVINAFIKYIGDKKQIAITAPTGIAALNIGGVTIHRTFGLTAIPLVDTPIKIKETVKAIDILIMDEVSMCRIDLFEQVMKIILEMNKHRETPIQVILLGDFFQLAPVITQSDRNILEQFYGNKLGNGFAFQSPYWEQMKFICINLNQIVRQNDVQFVRALNLARIGNKNCIPWINSNSCKMEIDGAITLCGTNKRVKERNYEELNKLPAEPKIYTAEQWGQINASDKVVDDEIVLKKGCRVMTVLNDSKERYVNGSFGTVIDLVDEDTVRVKMDNGCNVDICRNTWSIEKYTVKYEEVNGKKKRKLKKETIGEFKQIPLKLAYAITIHKSQGQTYDKVNFEPYCWDYGQLYVGLSRVRAIGGLFLEQSIKPEWLIASDDVKKFYRQNFKELSNI